MTVIRISDEQASALEAMAAAEGLTLKTWLQKVADESRAAKTPAPPPLRARRHISEVIRDNMRDVPAEVMANMPTDGAAQHDHYIYGSPKRKE